VTALAPGIALATFLLVAVQGLRMLRDRGPVERAGGAAALVRARSRPTALMRGRRRLTAWTMERLGPRRLDAMRRRLDAAGRPGGLTLEGFVESKVSGAFVLGAAGELLSLSAGSPLWVGLALVGWLVPDLSLSGQARRRRKRIEQELPDFLDILAVTVAAGVAFRAAMRRIAQTRTGPLADEVLTTLREMDVGTPRREAFMALRDRAGSPFLGQFVSSLLQAEELGTPLADAMGDIAREMRRETEQRGRQQAERAAPRVSAIVAMFILPAAILAIVAVFVAGSGVGRSLGAFGG
jgi:tight adherence protein C